MLKKPALTLILFFLSLNSVFADVVFLKNGSKMFGQVIEKNESGILLKMEYGEVFIDSADLAENDSSSKRALNLKKSNSSRKKKAREFNFSLPIGTRFKQTFAGVDCTVYYPSDFDGSKRLPMVVGLEVNGNGDVYMNLLESAAEEYGYIAVCPWTNGTQWRADWDWKVIGVVKEFIDRYKVDRRRVYATGFSGGGVFTYIVGISNPDYITAIAPVCAHYGGCAERFAKYKKGKKVPILMLHGSKDDICPPDAAKSYYKRLQKKGHKVQFKMIQGMGHESRKENNKYVFDFFNKNVKRRY